MTDMRAIVAEANRLDNSIENVNRELKRLASVKCRLKKMPGRSDFQANMTEVLLQEELLKNVKNYISGPRKTVNTLTQEEVNRMTLDEVVKAIKSIQSKKTHAKWQTTTPGDNDDFREACRIEEMLKARRDELNPHHGNSVSKHELFNFIATLRLCDDLDVETCLDRIEQFVEEA